MLLLKGIPLTEKYYVAVYVKNERSRITVNDKYFNYHVNRNYRVNRNYHVDRSQLKGFIKKFDNTFDDLPVKDEYSDSLSEDVATYGSLFFGVLGILGDIID